MMWKAARPARMRTFRRFSQSGMKPLEPRA
jgi:hypothetical protein